MRDNWAADRRLCFCYKDSMYNSILPKSEIVVQPGLWQTWSETLKTGFPLMQLHCPVPLETR